MDEIEILRAAASNANAFAELYRRHVTRVYRYHMAHVGIAKNAEDLTAQTFTAALEEFHAFRGSCSFAVWVMDIAAKKRLNDARGSRRALPEDAVLYYQSSGLPTDKAAMQRKEMEAMTRALKQIPTDQAEAIILMFFGDLTSSEVSHVLKKSAGTVTMLIGEGIERLGTRSSLAPDVDIGAVDADEAAERLAEKLTDIASQIMLDPHFISELEQTLVANHVPRTNWTFSLRQIASLAGWAALIGLGVFLLNWRVIPTSTSTNPTIVAAKSASITEGISGNLTSGPSPTRKPTATRIPTLEYIVQAGDTCTYIAERYAVTIDQLILLNDLNSACDIYVDQTLLIPITTPTPPN
ncbi:MAG TPA: sigma-70 family RNA polymerase sigma factor [Anaerolineales bacterium]|nr:sigma-70 family RNA polymerase sigma factor [Anaerolineales bacterium]